MEKEDPINVVIMDSSNHDYDQRNVFFSHNENITNIITWNSPRFVDFLESIGLAGLNSSEVDYRDLTDILIRDEAEFLELDKCITMLPAEGFCMFKFFITYFLTGDVVSVIKKVPYSWFLELKKTIEKLKERGVAK